MRLANRFYIQVKVEISEGLGGGSRQETSVKDGDEGEVVETKLFLDKRKQILELAKETLQRCRPPPVT